MTGVKTARSELKQQVSASLAAVEEFCLKARSWAQSLKLPNRFVVELLVREAVTNAAAHGCGGDPSKQIACILRKKPGRVIIAVRDEGPGFARWCSWNRVAAPNACSGRGLAIMRQYAHQLRFQERGNSIIMIQHFEEGTS